MIKLICKNCGEVWYTSNTKPNQKCSDCGGALIEDTLFNASTDGGTEPENKTSGSKIIQLNDYLSSTL